MSWIIWAAVAVVAGAAGLKVIDAKFLHWDSDLEDDQ